MKYIKYFFSTCLLLLAIFICSRGSHYPTYFFLGFSSLIIFGDIFIRKDFSTNKYSYPKVLDIPMYINFPFMLIFMFITVFVLGEYEPNWIVNVFHYLDIDIINLKNSITILDKISFIVLTSLFIGIAGTVPGHELTHRKRNKFDMFFGNWLLALSWDCAFAIEHVYGHHKNVGLESDPATAKRGENIYSFILRAIIKEQKDAWLIEFDHLKRRGHNPFGFKNRMIIGYIRSMIITFSTYIIGGWLGMLIYLMCAFIAKGLLEAINFTEHYGLVRVEDQPVFKRHSWNSNNFMSTIILYNLSRHSAHHEKSNLKYWELKPYPEAPSMPYGYLSVLYLVVLLPFVYHRIMAKKLIDWDQNHATGEEKKLAMIQNQNSGISLLVNSANS